MRGLTNLQELEIVGELPEIEVEGIVLLVFRDENWIRLGVIVIIAEGHARAQAFIVRTILRKTYGCLEVY